MTVKVSPRTPPRSRGGGFVFMGFVAGFAIASFVMMIVQMTMFEHPGGWYSLYLPDEFQVGKSDRLSGKGAVVTIGQDQWYAVVFDSPPSDGSDARLIYKPPVTNTSVLYDMTVVKNSNGERTMTFSDWNRKVVATLTIANDGTVNVVREARTVAVGTYDLETGSLALRLPDGPPLGNIALDRESGRWKATITNVSYLPTPAYALIATYNLYHQPATFR